MKMRKPSIKDQKGSSLLLVISVMLILTMLGTALIVGSATNIKLSAKYRDNTKNFFQVDQEMEQRLMVLDQVVKIAEDLTQWYLANEMYKLPLGAPELDLAFTWNSNTYTINFDTIGTIGSTYGIDQKDPNLQTHLASRWLNEVVLQTDYTIPNDFENKMAAYHTSVFNEVYFVLAERVIHTLQALPTPADRPFDTYTFTKPLLPIVPIYAPSIRVNMLLVNATIGKQIDMSAEVVIPTYSPVTETKYVSFRANPVWTNALTAQTGINLNTGSQSLITGDVYSAEGDIDVRSGVASVINGNVYTSKNLSITGNNAQITVQPYGGVPPAFNRYKKSLFLNDGDPVPSTSFYIGNETGYRVGAAPFPFSSYDAAGGSEFGFFSYDSLGGNVYANTVSVTDTVTSGGQIIIDGNVWVENDVEINSRANSLIKISSANSERGHLLGFSSESPLSSLPVSSTVNNNAYAYNAKIEMDHVYMPGLAFVKFDKQIDSAGNEVPGTNGWFRTIESVSSNNPAILSIYDKNTLYDASNVLYNVFKSYLLNYNSIDYVFELMDVYNVINNAAAFNSHINTHYNNASNKFVTHININQTDPASVNGYTTGILAGHYKSGATFDTYSSGAQISDGTANGKFSLISADDRFKRVFYSKTKKLFGDNATTGAFATGKPVSAFTDTSKVPISTNAYVPTSSTISLPGATSKQFIYYNGDLTINLTGDYRGIIYTTGNLTIIGDNTNNYEIKGTVISEQRISLSNRVNIVYDEVIVAALINNDIGLKGFFEVGEQGQRIQYPQTMTTTGSLTHKKRFKIIKWEEKTL